MPFEHETKFILKRAVTPEAFASIPGVRLQQAMSIKQLYMPEGIRLREVRPLEGDLPVPPVMMNYKKRTNLGPVEIETEISDADFNALAPHAETFLYKKRYVFSEESTAFDLELDIFDLAGWPTIMVMLEVEHNEGDTIRLDKIERLLVKSDLLTLRVPPKDTRFSNFALANPYYRIGLAASVYGNYPSPPTVTDMFASSGKT